MNKNIRMRLSKLAGRRQHEQNRSRASVLDMFATEGFWLFCGPRDLSGGAEFGTQFAYDAKAPCFPTTTVTYNTRYPVKNRRVSVYVAPSLHADSMVMSQRAG